MVHAANSILIAQILAEYAWLCPRGHVLALKMNVCSNFIICCSMERTKSVQYKAEGKVDFSLF